MNRWLAALTGLLLVTAGIYVQGLWTAGFVWDDLPLIVMNDSLGHLETLPALFTEDLWAASGAGRVDSGYYRPLVLLSFSLDKALFGGAALGYHLHSIAWHLLAVGLLFFLLRDIAGEAGALAGATVFSLHPVQSECVAWISARNDLMATSLGLFALVVLHQSGRSRVRFWLGVLLALGAVLSKESAILLPLLLLVLDGCRAREERSLRSYGALGLGLLLGLGLRALAGVGGAVLPTAQGWALVAEHLVDWVGIMGASVVWPSSVTSARDLYWTDLEPDLRVWVGWAGLVLAGVLGMLSRGVQRRGVLGGLAWLVAGLGLTLVPLADKGGFGDRFWYMPLVGVAVMVAVSTSRRLGPWLAVAVAVPALVVLSVRLPDWQDDAQMWAAAARDVPSPVNHVGLGHAMSRQDRLKRAHVAFAGALTTDRLANDACPRVVGSAVRMGYPAHGVRMGRWALRRGCPQSGELSGWMATAQALTGDWAGVRATLAGSPPDPSGRDLVLAAALARRDGNQAEADRIVGGRPEIAVQVDRLLAEADSPPATE